MTSVHRGFVFGSHWFIAIDRAMLHDFLKSLHYCTLWQWIHTSALCKDNVLNLLSVLNLLLVNYCTWVPGFRERERETSVSVPSAPFQILQIMHELFFSQSKKSPITLIFSPQGKWSNCPFLYLAQLSDILKNKNEVPWKIRETLQSPSLDIFSFPEFSLCAKFSVL